MDIQWCIVLLKDTIAQNESPEIHKSDKGAQYTSSEYIEVLKEHNIQVSYLY